MRYKLLGLEQLTGIKERWFREGLRLRLRIFAHFMEVLAAGLLHADEVIMTFTRSLPVNESEAAQMVAQLDGIVPRRMLLTQLHFVEDAEAAAIEMEAVQKKG
jgi:SPP1 family phage portal protein